MRWSPLPEKTCKKIAKNGQKWLFGGENLHFRLQKHYFVNIRGSRNSNSITRRPHLRLEVIFGGHFANSWLKFSQISSFSPQIAHLSTFAPHYLQFLHKYDTLSHRKFTRAPNGTIFKFSKWRNRSYDVIMTSKWPFLPHFQNKLRIWALLTPLMEF